MAMLGSDPITFDGTIYLRQSLSVPQGVQAFWSSKDGGQAIAVDYVTIARGDLVGKFDTIVLNPLDYEAVKKSMMDTPRKDKLRRDKVRGLRDLKGFDPTTKFKLTH